MAVLAVVCGVLRLPALAPESAHAASLPAVQIVTNPATTSPPTGCPTYGCLSPNGNRILDPVVPVLTEDRAGVDALQAAATSVFTGLHKGISDDGQIVRAAESDIRGIMWQLVRVAIATPAANRTEVQKDVYHWFQTVVRDYQLTAARNARTEFDTWTAQQCGYKPPTAEPAYYSGGGCDPARTGLQSLTAGAISPSVEQFATWGAHLAAQKLTSPRDHSTGQAFVDNALTSHEAGQELAQSVSQLGVAAFDLASVAVDWFAGGATTFSGAVTSQFALRLAAFFEPLIGGALLIAGPLLLAMALFSIVMGTIQQIDNAKIPGQLDEAISRANQLPDLQSWAGDGAKEALLYSMFLGQTAINNVAKPVTGAPDWHGDHLLVRAADANGQPVGPGTTGKAVALQTWGGTNGATTLSFLIDRGWFRSSTDGGASYLTTSMLRFKSWAGTTRTAILHGNQFVTSGGSGTLANNFSDRSDCVTEACGLLDTIKALDANGDRVFVTFQPKAVATATIQTTDTTFTAGEPTTFSVPGSDPAGTTYSWTFESRATAQSVANMVLCYNDPGTFSCDPAFRGNPGVTKSGPSVSYTWPRAGTYHVRLTATNEEGESATANRDVTVVRGAAPTIEVVTQELGPMRTGGVASIAGCLDTSPGAYALPTVTVDWGDGTTESASPPSGLPVLGLQNVPEPSFTVKPGGLSGPLEHCAGDWSFRATHTYTAASGDDFSLIVSADDGDGQSVSDTSLTAHIGPSTVTLLALAPTNVTETTNGVPGLFDGLPLYDAGELVDMHAEFDVAPEGPGYGYFVVFTWGDGGSTSFFRPGNCGSGCDTGFDAEYVYSAKPGAAGIGANLFTVKLLDIHGNLVSQWSTAIAVRTQTPTVTNVSTGPSTFDIGTPVTVSGDVSLPTNPRSPIQVTVDWSQTDHASSGPDRQTVTLPRGTTHFAVTEPRYVIPGTHQITVTVADNAGGVYTQTLSIDVENVPPTPAAEPVTGFEGTPVSLVVETGAPPAVNAYTQTVDWGDGTALTSTSYGPPTQGTLSTPEHAYAEAGVYTATVTLVDPYGGEGHTTTTVTVGATAPTVGLLPGAGDAGDPVALTGAIDDPGSADTFTGTVDWRDGSDPETFTRGTRGPFALTHTYEYGGRYAPVVVVTDQHGIAAPEASAVLTVDGPPAFTGPSYATPAGLAVDAPEGAVGLPYSFVFGVAGNPTPDVTVESGALPPGLTLDEQGILSGTPTTTGNYAFRLTATNTHGSATTAAPVEITIGTAPQIEDLTTAAVRGVGLDKQLDVAGFPAPTFATTGTLPPGLALSPSGRLSGAPTVPGTWTFTVTASNFVDAASGDVTVTVRETQDVRFTSAAPAAVVGGTYVPTATGGRSVNPVLIEARSPATCSMIDGVVTFIHPGACSIVATQADTPGFAEGSATQSVVVTKAATSTSLAIGRAAISAQVAVVAPGAGTPTGQVVFRVDGAVVDRADVVAGIATLTQPVPSGARREVSAAYEGDGDFGGSADSMARRDPAITAEVTSRRPESRFGWFRTAVTVVFTCSERGAALAEPCPAPVQLAKAGTGQSVTGSVSAVDGGIGSVTASGISIDLTDPTVKVKGPAANPRCAGSDALSGIASCQLTVRGKRVVTVTATAVDRAGNRTVVTRKYRP
jgi:PKD repeat protein